MIGAAQLKSRGPVSDPETDGLKKMFARLRAERRPLFLTKDEFDRVLKWKLRRQFNRQLARRAANTEEIIRAVTGPALTIDHNDPEYLV